jgi:hypothetical protein
MRSLLLVESLDIREMGTFPVGSLYLATVSENEIVDTKV